MFILYTKTIWDFFTMKAYYFCSLIKNLTNENTVELLYSTYVGYLPIYLSIYLSTYLIYLSNLSIVSIYLSNLPIYIDVYGIDVS